MNENSPLSYTIKSNSENVSVQRTILSDGRIMISTGSKIPGTYVLEFTPELATYQFNLLQGKSF